MSGTPLRLLLVEDSKDDELMVLRALRRGGYEPQAERVETPEGLRAALGRGGWDIVISDHHMPRFTSLEALAEVRRRLPDTPFIIVSGTIGDQVAVDAMRQGANDYVMKDNLARLAPAVRRELQEADGRRARRWAEHATRFLGDASHALARSLDLDETARDAGRRLVPTLGDVAMVVLLENGGAPRRLAVYGEPGWRWLRDPASQSLEHFEGSARLAELIRSGQNASGSLAPSDEPPLPLSDAALAEATQRGIRSWAVVRLLARGRALGAIVVLCRRAAYEDRDLALMAEFADRAAAAIDNARLYLEAQRALRLRDDFLAIAAHELFTPLTSLKLGLQSMRARQPRGDSSSSWDMVLRQVERLTRLVESLLDVSRIQRGSFALTPEDVDVGELVREVTARFREQARQTGTTLTLTSSGQLRGRLDRLRIEQAVSNLLSNAIKYGGGKPIEVTLDGDGAWLTLTIRDHGIGIAPERIHDIFEMYGRAVSQRHYGGLGLGLYLVRQIVDLHGGRVDVESTPGQGSRFTVHLPTARLPATAEEPALQAGAEAPAPPASH